MAQTEQAVNFKWGNGCPTARKRGKPVPVEEVKKAIDNLPEPSPEALYRASQNRSHLLHEELWNEDDSVWAQRGRLERCRHIIAAVHEVIFIGKKEIEVRVYEFARPNGEGRWFSIDDIDEDAELEDAYLDEIERLQNQASAKMQKFRTLRKSANALVEA